MTKDSGLAAVHAAANDSASAAAIAANTTVAELATAFPTQVAAIRSEVRTEAMTAGASAERERILGIEKISVPGHEALVASMKADPAVSVADAGLRLLAAEKEVRAGQLQGIKDVESSTSKVTSAPAGGGNDKPAETASTPDGWKAEYAKSDALKSEFGDEASYVAFKSAEAGGRIKVLHKK